MDELHAPAEDGTKEHPHELNKDHTLCYNIPPSSAMITYLHCPSGQCLDSLLDGVQCWSGGQHHIRGDQEGFAHGNVVVVGQRLAGGQISGQPVGLGCSRERW